MLIASHGRADVIADFDPATGAVQVKPRPNTVPFGATAGWFAILQGSCVVLFVDDDGAFRLQVAAQALVVAESTAISWSSAGGTSTLGIKDGPVNAHFTYPSALPRSAHDLTPFVEDEHEDFGLFLATLVGDPERMGRVAAHVHRAPPHSSHLS